jgi:hypothetical protein
MSKLGEIAMVGKLIPGLNKRERLVLGHIADCHTERMGSNTLSCECGNREVHYNSCRDRHSSIDQVRKLILKTDDSSYEEPEEIMKAQGASEEDTDSLKFGKSICCKCGREMIVFCMNDKNDFPSSGPGWLKRRLESRQNLHGPEPNPLRAS